MTEYSRTQIFRPGKNDEIPSHYGRGFFYVFRVLFGQIVDAFQWLFCTTV